MGRVTMFRWAALTLAAASLSLAGAIALAGSPTARAADAAVPPDTLLGIQGRILDVTASSPGNVWAVGYSGYLENGNPQMLIAHWNGTHWSLVKGLPLGWVVSISQDSSRDAWALAEDNNGNMLMLRFNGRTWSQDSSMLKLKAGEPDGSVAAVAGEVWVTADVQGPKGAFLPAMLHRTGGHWYVVPMPNVGLVSGFAVTSRTSIWATGRVLIHWNGSQWKSTSAEGGGAVTSGPDGSAWETGFIDGTPIRPYSLHFNGKTWTKFPVPTGSGWGNQIDAVTSIPHGTAWAVGYNVGTNDSTRSAVIMRWSGKSWTPVKAPATSQTDVELYAVTATSPSDAWAVGVERCNQEHCTQYTEVIHWNGKTWN